MSTNNTNASVFTFMDKDGLFELTVKRTFLDKCQDPSKEDLESLTVNHNLREYMHNPNGLALKYLSTLPAEVLAKLKENDSVITTKDGMGTCWLDGNLLTGEDLKKFGHDTDFMSKMDTFLATDDTNKEE